MADRSKALTASELAKRMRIPEENPNYVNDPNMAMLAPAMVYGGAFAPELGSLAQVGKGAIPAARGAMGEIPSYLSSARDVLMRRLGYQTPAARQAATRLMEPAAAEAATAGKLTTGQMAGRTALAGTPLMTAAAMAPSDSLPQKMLPSSAGMDRVEDPDFYRSMGANTFRNNPFLDRSENVPFSVISGAYLDRNSPSELEAYPRQIQGPPMPPAVSAAKREIPLPPSRELQAQARAEQPSDGILSRIFSGKDYQSNSRPVDEPTDGAPVNWGNPDSAADFFRADKARMAMEGKAGGGGVGGKPDKDAALHKALEIIHHMIRSR
jgi:hypothetical protein